MQVWISPHLMPTIRLLKADVWHNCLACAVCVDAFVPALVLLVLGTH